MPVKAIVDRVLNDIYGNLLDTVGVSNGLFWEYVVAFFKEFQEQWVLCADLWSALYRPEACLD